MRDTVEAYKTGCFVWQPDSEKHRAVFERLDRMEKGMNACTGTDRLMACDDIIVRLLFRRFFTEKEALCHDAGGCFSRLTQTS